MKAPFDRAVTKLLVLVSATFLAHAQVVNSAKNPNQIAILHWYGANVTTAFGVGVAPGGLAFDGANIWVANLASGTVTRLRASDGATLGTFPAGPRPGSVAFDGANIYVEAPIGSLRSRQRSPETSEDRTLPKEVANVFRQNPP